MSMSGYSITGEKIPEVLEVHRYGGTIELIFAAEAGFERLAAALYLGGAASADRAELVSDLLHDETPAFTGGATVVDDQGSTLATYHDIVPAVLEFDADPTVRYVTIRTAQGELAVPVPATGNCQSPGSDRMTRTPG